MPGNHPVPGWHDHSEVAEQGGLDHADVVESTHGLMGPGVNPLDVELGGDVFDDAKLARAQGDPMEESVLCLVGEPLQVLRCNSGESNTRVGVVGVEVDCGGWVELVKYGSVEPH